MLGVKEGAEIRQTDEGSLVDGEQYEPVCRKRRDDGGE